MTSEKSLLIGKGQDKANNEFLLSLLQAEDEQEVAKILGPLLSNDKSWKPLGGRWGNQNIVGDQQSDSTAALVENLVNSADAILIDRCMQEGLLPKSQSELLPQSMSEAMERYFGMKGGDPNSISSDDRIKMSENIGVVATGDKKYPSIACFDKGVGQNHSEFSGTFLSLPGTKDEPEKTGIPFVQGLYNMGSTGVLPFCGNPKNDYNFKLILSKRDPNLKDADGKWGFTIIRKIPPQKKHSSSTYVYLVDSDGEILTFETDSLPILPSKYPNPYGVPLGWGTYIKLYNYQLQKPSIIVLELLYELSHQLFRPAVPIRIYERRLGFESSHTLSSTMHGDVVRLKENENKIMEKGFPKTYPISIPDIGDLSVTIYILKKSERGKDWLGVGGSHRVIFTVNGQMHESKRQEFLGNEKVDKSYLAPDLLVIVNCDNMTDLAREKFFMPSRDRTRTNEVRTEIEQQLQDLLKNHDGLIELNNQRRALELEEARSDKKPLKSLINKLIKRSSAFSRLFSIGEEIEQPYDFKWKKAKRKPYEPSYVPSFFRIKDEKKIFEIPPNRGVSIHIETDAPNDYFTREKDQGKGPYILPRKFSNNQTLWNGMMRVFLKPKDVLKIGTEIPVSITIKDKSKDEPFELKFTIKIVSKKESHPTSKIDIWSLEKTYNIDDIIKWQEKIWISLQDDNIGNQPDSSPDSWSVKESIERDKNFGRTKIEIEGGKPQPMRALPPHTFVKKDDDDNWKTYEFDEGTGVHLIPNGDSFDFFINQDNKYYQEELSHAKSGEHELLQEQYAWGLILQCLAMIYEIKEKKPNMDSTEIAQMVTLASRGIAMSVIPTIKELSKNILR